jgi:two-component system, OmpR family, response regulator MprA
MPQPLIAHAIVVDDDVSVRALVSAAMVLNGYRVTGCADGVAALEALGRHEPDVMVLDVILPDLDGLTVARQARLRYPSRPILMLTICTTPEQRRAGMGAGADDYLAKPFELDDLAARVDQLTTRARDLRSKQVYRTKRVWFDMADRVAVCDGRVLQLTSAEAVLLGELMRHGGLAVGRPEMEAALRAVSTPAATRSIDIELSRLRDKLACVDEPPLIRESGGSGFVFDDAPTSA